MSQLQTDNSHSDLIFTCRKTDTGEFLYALNSVKYLNLVCTFELNRFLLYGIYKIVVQVDILVVMVIWKS